MGESNPLHQFSLLTSVLPRRRVKTGSRAASFWEVVAMILRGPQIHRDGHGKCGLLPKPALSSNTAQLPSSGVLANTRMSRCDSVVSHRHFKPEGQHVSDAKDRKPFHVTRAGCRVVRLPRA